MTRYIVQRLLLLPFLLLVYSFVIFVIMHAPPGDFLTTYVATLTASGSSISAEQIEMLRHQYGLDQPFIVQDPGTGCTTCCTAIWGCRWNTSGRTRS